MDRKKFVKAVRAWNVEEVRRALEHDAELARYTDSIGKTTLHHAAETNGEKAGLDLRDSVETVRVLIESGADVNAIRTIMDEGEAFTATPLWYAIAWGRNEVLARYLLNQGSTPEYCMWAATWAQNVELTRLLISHGASVDPVFHGETPFLQIVRTRRYATFDLLLENGADINFRDGRGYTPLHYAAKGKHTATEIKRLLDGGSDPTILTNEGATAAMLCGGSKQRLLEDAMNLHGVGNGR